VEKKKEVLLLATEVFSHADEVSSPSLRQIVLMGRKILGGLFAALDKRRVARVASALVPGAKKSDAPAESFAMVLQRLTQELDFANPASHLSPAPPDKPNLPAPPPAVYSSGGAYLAPPPVSGVGGFPAPPLVSGGGGSSAFGNEQQLGTAGGLPYDLNVVDLNSDAFMSSDFFRDVGLTAPNGSLAPFDFLQGTATPAPPHRQQSSAPSSAPYGGGGGVVEGYYGAGGAPPGWDFGAGGAAGGAGLAMGDGRGQDGRMAATALMDQLTTGGGVW